MCLLAIFQIVNLQMAIQLALLGEIGRGHIMPSLHALRQTQRTGHAVYIIKFRLLRFSGELIFAKPHAILIADRALRQSNRATARRHHGGAVPQLQRGYPASHSDLTSPGRRTLLRC